MVAAGRPAVGARGHAGPGVHVIMTTDERKTVEVHADPGTAVAPPAPPARTPARLAPNTEEGLLVALLSNPEELAAVPIDTVKEIVAMKMEMDARAAEREFAAAMIAVQSETTPVRRRLENASTGSWYADLDDILAMLQPLLTRHGFAHSVDTVDGGTEGRTRFRLTLRHGGGHVAHYHMDAPLDNRGMRGAPTKTELHGMASSYSYCTRYLLVKVFGLQTVDQDDDGSAASIQRVTEEQASQLERLAESEYTRAHMPLFLEWLQVDALADLPADRFGEALAALHDVAQRRKAREAGS